MSETAKTSKVRELRAIMRAIDTHLTDQEMSDLAYVLIKALDRLTKEAEEEA